MQRVFHTPDDKSLAAAPVSLSLLYKRSEYTISAQLSIYQCVLTIITTKLSTASACLTQTALLF